MRLFDRLLFWDDPAPRSGPENMAFDECLLDTASRLEIPVLRAYRWLPHWVSMGYFQSWSIVEPTLPPGVQVVRRLTGGGGVDHRRDQTYSLLLPRIEPLAQQPCGDSYAQIHLWLGAALGPADFTLAATSGSPASQAAAGWCFADAPVPGDLVCQGRKIAGAAQRRTRLGLLHQGSIHWPSPIEWGDAARLLATEVIPYRPSEQEQATAADLASERYETLDWLTRR